MRANAREDRRRRLLGDERVAVASTVTSARLWRGEEDSEKSAPIGYTDRALAEYQPRLGELIPTRPWTLWVLLLTGLSCVAGLEWLHVRHTAWHWWFGSDEYLAALDLGRPGSLGCWFSSLTLGMVAVASVAVYWFRRHKVDDYRGRYRVWLWCAAGALLASIDATCGIHDIVQGAARQVPGLTAWGDGAVWWMGLTILVTGLLGMDALFDLRHSRAAMAALATAAVCYTIAALVNLGVVGTGLGAASTMIESAAGMTAHLMLLTATATYLRHVFLDAQGLLPAAAERPADDGQLGETQRAAKKQRLGWLGRSRRRASALEQPKATPRKRTVAKTVEKPESKPVERPARPLAARIAAKKRASQTQQAPAAKPTPTKMIQDDRDVDAAHEPGKRKMTKAERKRLRKLRRQQRDRAA